MAIPYLHCFGRPCRNHGSFNGIPKFNLYFETRNFCIDCLYDQKHNHLIAFAKHDYQFKPKLVEDYLFNRNNQILREIDGGNHWESGFKTASKRDALSEPTSPFRPRRKRTLSVEGRQTLHGLGWGGLYDE
jgi:hypothetical protein